VSELVRVLIEESYEELPGSALAEGSGRWSDEGCAPPEELKRQFTEVHGPRRVSRLFLDANVPTYAAGRDHPLKGTASGAPSGGTVSWGFLAPPRSLGDAAPIPGPQAVAREARRARLRDLDEGV